MMERLTTKYCGYDVPIATCSIDREGGADDCDSCEHVCKSIHNDCDNCPIQKAFSKLAQYEDAEEAGLLHILPCKLGTDVFALVPLCDVCDGSGCSFCAAPHIVSEFKFDFEMKEQFGKTVFLTREEAEAALQAIQEDKQ